MKNLISFNDLGGDFWFPFVSCYAQKVSITRGREGKSETKQIKEISRHLGVCEFHCEIRQIGSV